MVGQKLYGQGQWDLIQKLVRRHVDLMDEELMRLHLDVQEEEEVNNMPIFDELEEEKDVDEDLPIFDESEGEDDDEDLPIFDKLDEELGSIQILNLKEDFESMNVVQVLPYFSRLEHEVCDFVIGDTYFGFNNLRFGGKDVQLFVKLISVFTCEYSAVEQSTSIKTRGRVFSKKGRIMTDGRVEFLARKIVTGITFDPGGTTRPISTIRKAPFENYIATRK